MYRFQNNNKLIGTGRSSHGKRKFISTTDSRNATSLSNWDRS